MLFFVELHFSHSFNSCHFIFKLPFFKKNVNIFVGDLRDTHVMDYWWCLLWVSKPKWVTLFVFGRDVTLLHIHWDLPLFHVLWPGISGTHWTRDPLHKVCQCYYTSLGKVILIHSSMTVGYPITIAFWLIVHADDLSQVAL